MKKIRKIKSMFFHKCRSIINEILFHKTKFTRDKERRLLLPICDVPPWHRITYRVNCEKKVNKKRKIKKILLKNNEKKIE